MVIDIRFKASGPIQIQNVRRVSVYPHTSINEGGPVLVVYSNNDSVPPQYFDIVDVDNFWTTND